MSPKKAPALNPGTQLCVVSIGLGRDLVMPMADGLKLVALLQKAMECNTDYRGDGYKYQVRGAPAVELKMVQPGQLVLTHPDFVRKALPGVTS